MTLTYISCSSDFYTFYINIPLSLGCMIRKVSAEDIAFRGNGTGLEYMCPTRHFVYIFFNPVFQVGTAKNEIILFNNQVLIVAPVTFSPAGEMTPSAEFLSSPGFTCRQQIGQCCIVDQQLNILKYFSYFSRKQVFTFNADCLLLETICMKCLILIFQKNIIHLSSAE